MSAPGVPTGDARIPSKGLTVRSRIAGRLCAAALAVGLLAGSGGAATASPSGYEATYLYASPARMIPYSPGGSHRPVLAALDVTGDRIPEGFAYCIEPAVASPSSVTRGTQKLTDYPFERANVADPGRVKWVLAHSYPAYSREFIVDYLALDRRGLTDQEVDITLVAATQAALYRFSHNMVVPANFRYDTRTTAAGRTNSALFTTVYQFLVSHAVPFDHPKATWRTWDNKKGDPATQTLIEVPKIPGKH
ncbi:MAG: thioester domain-containing protein [Mobilicoccus sp.]|nr:thioester domain-containing protein [Mobilicoccus sp.]